MQRSTSATDLQLVSRERVIAVMSRMINQEVYVAKRFSLRGLADESGVDYRVLLTWMTTKPEEQREPKLSSAMSVAVVLGRRSVNMLLSVIGYVGNSLDEANRSGPAMIAAEAMCHLGAFAKAAADDIIDHTEEPQAEAAVDNVIELLTPYSSRGRAA